MCRNENEQGCINSPLEDPPLNLLHLHQTIHHAVASIASTHQHREFMTAAAASDSHSASSQVAAPDLTESELGPLVAEISHRESPGSKKARQRGPKTARGLPRIGPGHVYVDYASVNVDPSELERPRLPSSRGGASSTFPRVLHQMLEDAEPHACSDVIAWLAHGRAWKVFNQDRFIKEIMPKYFRQTKFRSFQRQLCLYGFKRLTRKGPDCGGYYHQCFLRGKPELLKGVHRMRIKGCLVRQSSSPDSEPDFWSMPAVGKHYGTSSMQSRTDLKAPPATAAGNLEVTMALPMAHPPAANLTSLLAEPRKKRADSAAHFEATTVGPTIESDPREDIVMVYPAVASPGLFLAEARRVPPPSLLQDGVAGMMRPPDQTLLLPLPISAPLMSTFEEEGALVKFLNDLDWEESEDDEDIDEQLEPIPL